MSQILEDIAPQARIGVLSGPNLAREVAEHALTASVVASEDEDFVSRFRLRCMAEPSVFMPVPTVLASSWAVR